MSAVELIIRSILRKHCPCPESASLIFCSLLDDCCKSNNQAKMEKRGPPGTVEFIVSNSTLMTRLNNMVLTVLCCVMEYFDIFPFHRGVDVLLQVGPNDSLNSIALKFNITPNKLVQLNKLFSRSVYPGQVRTLRVPHYAASGSTIFL